MTSTSEPIANFVAGSWVRTGEVFHRRSPSDAALSWEVSIADEALVDEAVRSARDAMDNTGWAASRASERASALLELADQLEANGEELAALASAEMGKPLLLARDDEVGVAADRFRYFASAARAIEGSVTGASPAFLLDMVRPEPAGVAALILPWNDPVELVVRKLGAALAAGCGVVMKSSEYAPATVTRFIEFCLDANALPPGLINLVHGPGLPTGETLIRHPGVAVVSFTGSTRAGRAVYSAAAAGMKRVAIEAGGKAPALVFADCDRQRTIDGIAYGAFLYSGQSCTAISRLIVEETVHDAFLDELRAKVETLTIGDPLDESNLLGPLVSESDASRVADVVKTAIDEGGTLVTGGTTHGAYFSPTIISDVSPKSSLATEEVFGPVLAVIRVRDDDEALAVANGVEYGLAASVWTSDVQRALRFARELESGDVWINTHYVRQAETPFGGWKQSGTGRELGQAGVETYLRWKRVAFDERASFHLAEALG